MRVFVVGHRGMLGHVAARYYSQQGLEVVTSEARYGGQPDDPLIRDIQASNCSWVINALGRIKQKKPDTASLYLANTVFPLHLRLALNPGQRLIHASSDCVYSGKQGAYAWKSQPDPSDDYGISKACGEAVAQADRAYVIRTSVIGPECSSASGLMAWFFSQQGTVPGFTNHVWNGITTLEWAKLSKEIMDGDTPTPGPFWQVATQATNSKFELLRLMALIWKSPHQILPTEAKVPCDRSLLPTWTRKPIAEQLTELHTWYT